MAQLTERRSIGAVPEQVEQRRATPSAKIVHALRGKPALTTGLLLLPGTVWMLVTVGTALVSIVIFSFWTSGFTGLRPEYTLANYQSLLRPGSSFWGITIWTLQVVVLLLVGVIVLSYPVSYALWRVIKSPYWKSALLLLFIVPFWTSYLTRTITWLPMFGREGVVNQVLMATRLTQEPVEFLLYSRFSMMVALWFLFIVFMVGPIYFAMQRIDEDVMSAAAVYGAGPWRSFFQVVVPLTLPGMLAGLIQRQIDVFQFAGAAAVAVSLIVITLVIVGAMLRSFDIRRI